MYQLQHEIPNAIKCVKRLTDNAFIPFDLRNIDYQQYLTWLAEGNTPEPAEPQNKELT
jgi:hypothetical protein